jgi:hypothetical protein
MSDDRPVTDLVTRARNNDKRAWDDLVEQGDCGPSAADRS